MTGEQKKTLEHEILRLTDRLIEAAIQLGDKEEAERKQEFVRSLGIVQELAQRISQYLSGKEEHLEELLRQLTRQKLPDQSILNSFTNFSANLNELIIGGLNLYQQLKNTPLAETEETDAGKEWAEETGHLEIQPEEEQDSTDLDNEEIAVVPVSDEVTHSETREDKILEKQDCLSNRPLNNAEQSAASPKTINQLEKILMQIFPGKKLVKGYKFHGFEIEYFFPELNLAIEKNHNPGTSNSWKEYHCLKAGITLVKISDEELGYYRRLSRHLKHYLASLQKSNTI